MSFGRKQRFATPDPIDVQTVLRNAQQASLQARAFEQGQFPEFFKTQERLGQVVGESLAPLGELSPGLQKAFEQNIASAQSQRGLATSPVGAVDAAQKLAALQLQQFQVTTGAAQRFQSEFRSTTGFSPSGADLFQASVLQQQQEAENRAALFNLRESRKARKSQRVKQGVALVGAAVATYFGGPVAGLAVGGALGLFAEQQGSGAGGQGVASGLAGVSIGQAAQLAPTQVNQPGVIQAPATPLIAQRPVSGFGNIGFANTQQAQITAQPAGTGFGSRGFGNPDTQFNTFGGFA